MTESVTHVSLSTVKAKIQKLGEQKQKLSDEFATLLDNKKLLEDKLSQRETAVQELQEKLKLSKMAKTLGDEETKNSDAKYKINELVREIDQCIALLNR